MKKITRKQTEEIILDYCEKIRFILEQYETHPIYLSIAIQEDSISFNNNYWDDVKPLKFFILKGDTDEA